MSQTYTGYWLYFNKNRVRKYFFSNYNCLFLNEAISSSKFPSSLTCANITPAFKKCCRNLKKNYRSVSILPVLSKIFEKLMSKQLATSFQSILSKFQCLERIQHTIVYFWTNGLGLLKIIRHLAPSSQIFLKHLIWLLKLRFANWESVFLWLTTFFIMSPCGLLKKQDTKVEPSYSSWEDIEYGVPRESILGPLPFNIFLCDLSLVLDRACFLVLLIIILYIQCKKMFAKS